MAKLGKITLWLMLLMPLLLVSCQSDRDRGTIAGTRKGVAVGEEEGRRHGRQRGQADGTQAGRARARQEAERGAWLGIYLRPGIMIALLAFGLGLAAQYVALDHLGKGARNEKWGVLIPELTRSVAYHRWDKMRQIMADARQQLVAQRLSHETQNEAMQNLAEIIRKAQSIEQLSHAKIRELVDAEIARARERVRR